MKSVHAVIATVLIVSLAFALVIENPYTRSMIVGTAPSSVVTQVQTQTQGGQQASLQVCQPGTQYPVKVLGTHYSSDNSLTDIQWNRFYSSGSTLVTIPDNPSNVTDGTLTAASANSYSLTQGIYDQIGQNINPTTFTSAAAYPMWVQESGNLLTTPQSAYGSTTFSVSCPAPTYPGGATNWNLNSVLFEAPTSGASATTNVKAYVNYEGTTPSAMPTTPTSWAIQLNVLQTYKAAMLPYAECGTGANPVTNYATGVTYQGCPNGPGQGGLPISQGYLLIVTNQTGISVALGSSAPAGMTLQAITGNQLSSGTRAWAISIVPNSPAPGSGVGSSSPYIAVNVPISIYETVTQGSHHAALLFGFVDMQQYSYLNTYFTDPANSGTWPASTGCGGTGTCAGTASAGTPSGFGGLTPTTGYNSGNPSPLISQWDSVYLQY